MRTMSSFAIPLVVLGLLVPGCSSDDGSNLGTGDIGSTNDINPRDRSEVADGGNLRLAITSFPATFNNLHVDGGDPDTTDVISPTMPAPFVSDAKGKLTVDHNYFTDVQLTSTNPQRVTYTINPKAQWSDGAPITWEDLRAQAAAQAGIDRGFLVASTAGFERVATVERGVDDRQAIVTFAKPYSEWKGQFDPLYPRAVTENVDAFNDFARAGLPISAGPFVISDIDRTRQRITLSRNPKWWGDTPKLDTITFSVLDTNAWLPAIENNELDSVAISGLEDVTVARKAPGVVIRRAAEPIFSVITFNGAPGSILEDPRLRVALGKAIDRHGIVTSIQHGIVADPAPLNNHIYIAGQHGYQDNSAPMAYNPAQAAAELDALGWKLNGAVREKDGRKLELRDVMLAQLGWVDTAQIVQENLAAVGVKVIIQPTPGTGLFTDVIDPGNFEIAQHGRGGSVLPLASLAQVYSYDPNNLQGNKARVGTPELNALIEQTLAELDPEKAVELANKCDQMIWAEGHSLPLTQDAGTHATRANLANFGAFGLASIDYTKAGFLK